MFLKPDPKGEFEDSYLPVVPTEQEVRMVTNKNKECLYWWVGLGNCRKDILLYNKTHGADKKQVGFLGCKEMADEYYKCMTDGQGC